MAHNDNSIFPRIRFRPSRQAAAAPEPAWRENMRDLGLMMSGVYQDLRGDTRETYSHFHRWLVGGLRKQFFRAPRVRDREAN